MGYSYSFFSFPMKWGAVWSYLEFHNHLIDVPLEHHPQIEKDYLEQKWPLLSLRSRASEPLKFSASPRTDAKFVEWAFLFVCIMYTCMDLYGGFLKYPQIIPVIDINCPFGVPPTTMETPTSCHFCTSLRPAHRVWCMVYLINEGGCLLHWRVNLMYCKYGT